MMIPNENGFMRAFDISVLSRHLFAGKGVVSWAFQEDPYPLIWVVRSDGALLSCAFNQSHELIAWTQHEIQGGLVLSVCSIPEGYIDSVYVVVSRGGELHIERIGSRLLTEVRDAVTLDASATYDGRNTDPDLKCSILSVGGDRVVGHDTRITFTTGTEAVEGEHLGHVVRVLDTREVDIYDDEVHGDYKKTEVVVCEILLHTANAIDDYRGELLTPLDPDLDGVTITTYEWCKFVIDGLAHLEGEEVSALVDGAVVVGLEVSGGSVVLGEEGGGIYGAVVCVGLPYVCDFESLKVATERGRVRIVKSVLLETYGRVAGYVGQSLNDPRNLEEVATREVQHEYGVIPLSVEQVETTIKSAYDIEGTIAFRQSEPLPVEITAIVRDLEFGG